MRQSKWRKQIEDLGFSYKKEIFKILFLNLFLLSTFGLVVFVTEEILFVGLCVIALSTTNYLQFSHYSTIKRKNEQNHNEELIALLSYFQTFIDNKNTVYQAFQRITEFGSAWMKDKIGIFLTSIDNDKSVQPFIDFAGNFTNNIAKNLMLSIYQMIDQGEISSRLNQFTFLFQSVSSNYSSELRLKKQRSLAQMNTFPLIGAGAIVMILSFSIISVVGDMVNVL